MAFVFPQIQPVPMAEFGTTARENVNVLSINSIQEAVVKMSIPVSATNCTIPTTINVNVLITLSGWLLRIFVEILLVLPMRDGMDMAA